MNYLSKHKSLIIEPKELLQVLNVINPTLVEDDLTKEILTPPTTKLDVVLFFGRTNLNIEAEAYTKKLKEVFEKLGVVGIQSLVIHF